MKVQKIASLLVACLFLVSPSFASEPEADLIRLTDGPIQKLVELVARTKAPTLEAWAQDPFDSGVSKKEFCSEENELKTLFQAAAEWMREAPGPGDPPMSEAHAHWRMSVYHLISARPATKEKLLGVLQTVKAVAPADGKTAQEVAQSEALLNGPKPSRIRISAGHAACYLAKSVEPISPRRAKNYVVLRAVIGTDGSVKELYGLEGEPDFMAASAKAVWQWKYRPYYFDGEPIEVETQITIRYE